VSVETEATGRPSAVKTGLFDGEAFFDEHPADETESSALVAPPRPGSASPSTPSAETLEVEGQQALPLDGAVATDEATIETTVEAIDDETPTYPEPPWRDAGSS
jgi:hypothetical protein